MRTFLKVLKIGLVSLLAMFVIFSIAVRVLLSRTGEFRAKAKEGDPIVTAIERFKYANGAYPESLSVLVPSYLPSQPQVADITNGVFGGWDYQIVTNIEYHLASNVTVTSYTLRYYMGRGGIEYQAPYWLGNDEGHRSIVRKHR